MFSDSRLSELSDSIAKDIKIFNDYFRSRGLVVPSFDETGPQAVMIPQSDTEAATARTRLLDATHELRTLVMGPMGHFRNKLFAAEDMFTLQIINRFKIAQAVPVCGEISYQDLSSITKIPTSILRRILRYAMLEWVFEETPDGQVKHTCASRLLSENKLIGHLFNTTISEFLPAGLKGVDALKQHPGSQRPTWSGWGLANNAQAPFFEELSLRHPDRAAEFARVMDTYASFVPMEALIDNYPWAALGPGLVVDVGGGHGPASIGLARAFPQLRFIVQDLPSTVDSSQVPDDLKGRLEFMRHDFFASQPVNDADVYFFRAIFHNWPDLYCIRLLRALIPALKSGAKVVINEPAYPDLPRGSRFEEAIGRASDLRMMTLLCAENRPQEAWASLFKKADARFEFHGLQRPGINRSAVPSSDLFSIIEAEWKG